MAIIQDVTQVPVNPVNVKHPQSFSLPSKEMQQMQLNNNDKNINKTVPPMTQFAQNNMGRSEGVKPKASTMGNSALNRTANKPWMPFGTTIQKTPAATFETQPTISATEKAIEQLEMSYDRMLASINLNMFKPEKINHYIRAAEKRSGVEFSEEEKDQIRHVSRSGDDHALRLLALELRIGVPKKLEREALSALGELMLHRHNTQILENFLDDPHKDDNLKAHIRTILMMNKVETAMMRVDSWKKDLSNLTKGITSIFGRS